jgi:hypothetical protein
LVEEETRAGGFDGFPRVAHLVGRQVVHDDDVAVPQRRREQVLDVGDEGLAVHRPVEDHRRRNPVEPQAGHQRGRLPVAVRDRGAAALAPRAASAQARHPGARSGLVDEDEPGRVEVGLELGPGLAARGYVGARLLAGVRSLF